MKKTGKKSSKNIRKKAEFLAFLDSIRGSTVAHWIQIAETLGVNKDTINRWKKYPEAKEAIRKGIKRAMNGMKRAGKGDWRMWESKLKMLGISPIEKADITSGGAPLSVGVVSYKPKKE